MKKLRYKVPHRIPDPQQECVLQPLPLMLHNVITRDNAKKAVKRAVHDSFDQMINDCMLCCIDILVNDFGKLQRRKGRTKAFWQLYMDRLSRLENEPGEKTKAAYKVFEDETGMPIVDL